jgi:hypothetical protein
MQFMDRCIVCSFSHEDIYEYIILVHLFICFKFLGRSRLNSLLQGIKSEGNEAVQLQCLMELCDFLSIGTEDTMSNFAVDQFVPAITNLLNFEHNPDMMCIQKKKIPFINSHRNFTVIFLTRDKCWLAVLLHI